MASCKKPVYKVEIKSISEKKRRKSDLVIMWQSILDLSLCVLDKCWAISNSILETTKVWIKADDQREIMTWLEKHLPAVPRDFTNSWRDGVLLSVLLNKLRPGCFPDAENLDTEYGLKNVYRALNVLEARFKIVPKVTAEEIVTCCNGSDQKLQDLLLQLKQETDKAPLNNAEEQCERTVSPPPETTSDTCIASGTGLLVGFVGREANFVVHFTALSELDLVMEIRGPSNELCSERITKRSPKRKQSVRNWRPSPPCLERSHSESNNVLSGTMPGAEEDAAKKPQESRHIPLKYEIRANQVSFTYTPFTKGRHKVSILHHGQHITDSPYSVTVEPQVGTYKSSLKAPKIDDGPKKECAVRIQVPEENKRSFGKVVKRRVLRYIVKIDKKDIVVDTDSIDQLASALLKMDYELQKRPLIRRNSWGFVGDAERKVSMIRQFCVDVDELEAQSLKMHRSHSLTIVPKPKKAFPKNASYECEDILGRSRLETVTEGKDRKMSSHREEEEEALAYLDEEFDSDKPARDESTKSENAMEISRLGEEATIQPTLFPFSWPSHGVSSEQRREEILESGEIQPDSDIETHHRGSESSGPLFLSSSASNLSFSQSMEASLENDLNTEGGKTKAGGAGDAENNHPYCPDSEIFCSDTEDPFTKIVVKNLGNKFVYKENSVHRIMEVNELNKNPPENVQLFNFCPQNTNEVNSTNNKQYNSSLYKNVDSNQVFIPSCCGNRRQRSCHYKTNKHRNNYKNCVIKPLNVVYFPVYKDYFYKRSSKSSKVQLEKRSRNNDQNVSINSNFGQNLSKQNHHPLNTPKETLTVKSSNKKMNETDTNYHSKSIDVTKISDSSSTKQQNFPSKSFNTNVNEAYRIVPNFQELNSLYTRPYKNNHFEPNHTSNAAQRNSKDSTKQFSIIKQPLVHLGQFNYKHFNPAIANKKDGPVKLRVKQWQKHMCEEPQKVKVVQKADTLPEKGNLTAKLKFWENVVQRENNEASSDEPSSLKCRQNVNETLQREKDYISENSTSVLLNIIETPAKVSDAKPSKSKENLCSPSHNQDLAEIPNDKLVIPTTTRVRKRSFSDPGHFQSSAFRSSDVSDLTETLPEPIREGLSWSSDANYLELSADDEMSSVDLLYSTEDEYIDDEISDTASTYWGDLSFIKDLKLSDASAYREFCSLVDSNYLTDRRDSLDSCPYECQVYGIANYFGHVAVKNRFRVLTNGAGWGNLSATVQGLGHHEVSFVSVEYVQKDVYEVTYQVLTPGLYLISVRWMESPISGSPFLCKVTF